DERLLSVPFAPRPVERAAECALRLGLATGEHVIRDFAVEDVFPEMPAVFGRAEVLADRRSPAPCQRCEPPDACRQPRFDALAQLARQYRRGAARRDGD